MKPWTWRHAIINSSLRATTRHVLLTLSCHVNDAGEPAYPSTALLAVETGLSERAVITHLHEAAAAGWLIVRKHGYGGQKWARNQYYPRVPVGFEIVEHDDLGTESGSVPSKKGGKKKALKDVQQPVDNSTQEGTEARSAPEQKALNVVPEGTEGRSVEALNHVQSNTAVNPAVNTAAAATREAAEKTAAAAAQKISSDEKADAVDALTPEAKLLAVLAMFPSSCAIDPQADRVHLLTWVGKGVTPAQLADAVDRALVRRKSAGDDRPVYAKFLDRFVCDVLAGIADAAAPVSSGPVAQWWLSDSGIGAQGRSVRVERRGPHEPTADYLIRVAKASGRGPWIDYVLHRERCHSRFPEVVAFIGDELLPVDFYAS
ncbi:helix-turn-helix domain-containing protein [Paraburkholderia silvatlantica]|uniref:Helix-turn-helix protein n=1 Tax=Paraburkholderia silvatlantica TaxID=321895 RepID=A0ABR6FLQ6_9BURK|nr:helix-turn-helix domain-containing protein [Paraburkholderia silvatlantica]MBB2928369.1 hypothetical protein [Paraburkholderia silvatlantica]PVY34586.1 hypothetical protein C7411_107122 [Paraburkholderia silvatlantica]PXW38801.1 hypothetical protein C7413_107122 [Paraburkholderia silvatlantica]